MDYYGILGTDWRQSHHFLLECNYHESLLKVRIYRDGYFSTIAPEALIMSIYINRMNLVCTSFFGYSLTVNPVHIVPYLVATK